MPERSERGQRFSNGYGWRELPERVELDHDVHAIADPPTDFFKWRQRLLQVLARDVMAMSGFGSDVEWPNLHRGDSYGENRLGQIVGPMKEIVQIVETRDACRRSLIPETPIAGG